MCSFGSCKTRFEFLSQFRKVRNAFECFVTQVQTRLPKTKCVWPMKINVICTVNSQRDVVTHTMSVYADLALNGLDDALSSIRGARPARPYGWISHWHERPARSFIMTMSSLLVQNSEVF